MPDAPRSLSSITSLISVTDNAGLCVTPKRTCPARGRACVCRDAAWRIDHLEVIGRPYIGRAFDRRSGSNLGEQGRILIGTELIGPVTIADIGVPSPGLPQNNFDVSKLKRTSSKISVLVSSVLLNAPRGPKQPRARHCAVEMPVPFGPITLRILMTWANRPRTLQVHRAVWS